MECESCGRYRPSSEILPMPGPAGVTVMACAMCRGPMSVNDPMAVVVPHVEALSHPSTRISPGA